MATPEKTVQDYLGFDYYGLDSKLTEKQLATRDKVRSFVNEEVLPNINPYWEKAEFPWEIANKIPELGIIGGPIPTHGGAGMDFFEMV